MSQQRRMEFRQLRQELQATLSRTNPTDQFRAQLLLTMVSVSFTASQMEKARNPKERRRLIDEWNRKRNALGEGLRLLEESSSGRRQPSRALLGSRMS
ncbi:MAG: hypothetical protein SWE60_16465 [Thermodesulfobacteriota bacterium]|nr:hypothetical protein [Thermodesulfobacteriota bacterium]